MLTRRSMPALVLFLVCTLFAVPALASSLGYEQINLTSNVPNLAPNLDPNLRNPWGMSFGPNTPFWVSNQVTNVATLYSGAGVPVALVVATPPVPGPGPTGQVFVGGLGFTMSNAQSASFVFATLAGTIDAWNGGTSAIIQHTTAGAAYTGLAQLGSQLYAADAAHGRIDVFDNNFAPVTVSGSFVDPQLPAGFTPYNVQTINGQLYVTYEQEDQPGGFIAIFDANGNFVRHISDSHLDSPWGLTLAPAGFGEFGGALLVGNEEDGRINAFDATTFNFLGTLSDSNGVPIENPGLWALEFRSPLSSFDPNALFFTAGINDEEDGLFGEIRPVAAVPEPMTLTLVAAGAMLGWRRARRIS
jgi:uncharacterized protein (TIGR03118 family)